MSVGLSFDGEHQRDIRIKNVANTVTAVALQNVTERQKKTVLKMNGL